MRKAIAGVALAVLVAGVYASQSYHAPSSGEAWKVTRVYMKGGRGEKGVIAFLCNHDARQHRIQIYARGLSPNYAHALWLMDDHRGKGKAGTKVRVTRGPFHPKADRDGVLKRVVTTRRCLVGGYDRAVLAHLMVPDMIRHIALEGTIRAGAHDEDEEHRELGPIGPQ